VFKFDFGEADEDAVEFDELVESSG